MKDYAFRVLLIVNFCFFQHNILVNTQSLKFKAFSKILKITPRHWYSYIKKDLSVKFRCLLRSNSLHNSCPLNTLNTLLINSQKFFRRSKVVQEISVAHIQIPTGGLNSPHPLELCDIFHPRRVLRSLKDSSHLVSNWCFTVHKALSINLTFLFIHFSQLTLSNSVKLLSNGFKAKHLHTVSFYGEHSLFSIFLCFQKVTIEAQIAPICSNYKIKVLYCVQDRNVLKTRKVIEQWKPMPSFLTTSIQFKFLLHVFWLRQKKHLHFVVNFVNITDARIFDGPDFLVQSKYYSNGTFVSSSFQCVLQLVFVNNSTKLWQFQAKPIRGYSKLYLPSNVSTNVNFQRMFGGKNIRILQLIVPENHFVNTTMTDLFLYGRHAHDCRYGGVVCFSLGKKTVTEGPTVCHNHSSQYSPSRSFISSHSSQIIFSYQYREVSSVVTKLQTSITNCKTRSEHMERNKCTFLSFYPKADMYMGSPKASIYWGHFHVGESIHSPLITKPGTEFTYQIKGSFQPHFLFHKKVIENKCKCAFLTEKSRYLFLHERFKVHKFYYLLERVMPKIDICGMFYNVCFEQNSSFICDSKGIKFLSAKESFSQTCTYRTYRLSIKNNEKVNFHLLVTKKTPISPKTFSIYLKRFYHSHSWIDVTIEQKKVSILPKSNDLLPVFSKRHFVLDRYDLSSLFVSRKMKRQEMVGFIVVFGICVERNLCSFGAKERFYLFSIMEKRMLNS